MRIVFIGAPGAGKGTQAARLAQKLAIPHLSTGEILREAVDRKSDVGKVAETYLADGQLVPDLVVVQIVGERLGEPDCETGCLFDGFPRTVTQAHALDELLSQRGTPLRLVMELRVDDTEVLSRLQARGRADDTSSAIAKRLQSYEVQTKPLLDYYRQQGILKSVDGAGTVDEVFDRVWRVTDEIRQA